MVANWEQRQRLTAAEKVAHTLPWWQQRGSVGGKIIAEEVLREDRSRSKWEAVEVGMAGEEDRASKTEDSEEQRPQRPGRQWPQEECTVAAWP